MKHLNRKLNRALRTGVAGAALLAGCVVSVPSLALAQQSTTATSTETVIVTGSRIQRKDADSVGIISTLTEADIKASGATSVGDLLQKLPSAGVSLNSNGTQGTSYGASSINLRYLGGGEGSGNRVLVLVDGHRWVDGVGQRGFRDFVDLNTMPFGMIESIEVLKDGASAIYGADAIAGVVNIKTLRNFDGLRVSARTSVSSESDGEQYSATLNWGKEIGTGSLVVSASYARDEPILTADRALTALTLVPQTTPGNSDRGLYILPGLSNNAFFGTPTGFAASTVPVTTIALGPYGAGANADNSFRTAALPADFYNLQAQGIYSVGPSERYGVYSRFTADLSDTLRFKAEVVLNRRVSDQLFSPVLLDVGGTAGTIRGFAIPNNHPFNPFGTANGVPTANALAFNANSAWRIRRVMNEVGNRDNIQEVDTYRMTGGFDGTWSVFGKPWAWDAFASYSRNEIKSSALNGINYDNLALGLGSTTVCAATPGCVPVNLFAPMTPEAASWIRYTTRETNSNDLWNLALNTTGDLFELPAGPVSVAMGYEYRQNNATDTPDVYVNSAPVFIPTTNTRTSGQTRVPTRGKYNLHEGYVEFAVPLLKDAPLAQSLDLSLAARYSSYNTVGDATTFKVGLGWRPIEDILVRGNFSQGFRAPSILELFQGGREVSLQGIDPCNGGAAANPTRPGCVGIPANYNQSGFNLNGLIPGTVSGNTKLKPETADTYTLGVAIQPSILPGFSLTVDWYKITITDAIATQTATEILNLCAVRGGVFCELVVRDPATGAVRNLIQGAQNLSEIKTSGIDTTIRYDFKTSLGRFAAVIDASYLDEFTTTTPNPAGGAPIIDERAGKGDRPRSTYPQWKGQASLRWAGGPWSGVWRGRYIGESTDVVNTVKDSNTDAIFYQDLEAGYSFERFDTTITIGVNNLFDKQPPASYANAPINYDIYTYDARGRTMYARLGMQF